MEESVDFLNLSPIQFDALSTRLAALLRLKENLGSTIKCFQDYAEAGSSLCVCMQNLAGSFESYNIFQTDPTLGSISGLLNSFQTVLGGHYAQVRDHIVGALETFLKTDIPRAEEVARKATHDVDAYMKYVDTYATTIRKRQHGPTDDHDKRLQAAHFQAVISSFRLERTLSLVERKQLFEVTANVHFICCLLAFSTIS
jgi:hypothetical protein